MVNLIHLADGQSVELNETVWYFLLHEPEDYNREELADAGMDLKRGCTFVRVTNRPEEQSTYVIEVVSFSDFHGADPLPRHSHSATHPGYHRRVVSPRLTEIIAGIQSVGAAWLADNPSK